MTEGTKALNSAVSTLKKNPGRIGRLVKAAQFLIVPPKQYSKGKARELAEAAVAKLKAKRGLNGVVGEGAGSFSDKALQKKAEDKKGAGYAAAGGAVGAGVGRAMAREYQKNTIIIRGSDRTIRQIQAGKPSSKIRAQTPVFNRRAAKTLKGAGRLGALAGAATGAVAGLGVRKVKNQMEKKAVDKKTQDRALAASAVGSGAALGGVLTHDAKKSRVTSRMGTKGAYKHMGDPSVEGAEKRLANSAKTLRRMGKPLRRAGIKGAIVGGLAGAALGAAHLKKEAAAKPAVIPKQEFIGKGKIPAGAKDVSPKAVLKRKGGKVGKIALGVAAGAALAGAAKKRLEKKAEEKKSKKTSVAGLATLGAAAAGARRFGKDSNKFIKGTVQQAAHIERKGGKIGPRDIHMAMESGVRPILRRTGKAALKGAAVGALGAALYKYVAEERARRQEKARRKELQKSAATVEELKARRNKGLGQVAGSGILMAALPAMLGTQIAGYEVGKKNRFKKEGRKVILKHAKSSAKMIGKYTAPVLAGSALFHEARYRLAKRKAS